MKRVFIILGLFIPCILFARIDGNRDLITYNELNSVKASTVQANILSNRDDKRYTVSRTTSVIADFYDLQTAVNSVPSNSILILYPGIYDLGTSSLCINKPISLIAMGDGQANYGNAVIIRSAGNVTIKIDFNSNEYVFFTGLFIVCGSNYAVYNDNNLVSMYMSNCYLSASDTGLYWNETTGGGNSSIYKSQIEGSNYGIKTNGSVVWLNTVDSQISGFSLSAIHLLDAVAVASMAFRNCVILSPASGNLIKCDDVGTVMTIKTTNNTNFNSSPQQSNIIYDKSGEL